MSSTPIRNLRENKNPNRSITDQLGNIIKNNEVKYSFIIILTVKDSRGK